MPRVMSVTGVILFLTITMASAQQPTTLGLHEVSKRPSGDSRSPGQTKDPALSPDELFRHVAPSVFVVEASDDRGSVATAGSGVAVGIDQVVTNKHVIDSADSVRLRKGNKTWRATVARFDPEHDLCELKVQDLRAPLVPLRASSGLIVGEQVYAVGAPEGLELTLSEGLISGLREFDGGGVIQTTAPISHGSSGGGLFDEQGRLIGITTFFVKEGQNLNFALPADWVIALSRERARCVQEMSKRGNSRR